MLEITQGNLKQGLAAVGITAAPQSSLPVLANVLIEAGSVLTMTTTNLEQSIQVKLPADIKEKFRITVPVRQLASMVASRPDEKPIKMKYQEDDMSLKISQSRWRATIKGIDADEFPLLHKDFPADAHLTIPLNDFLHYLGAVSFSADPSGARPVLEGIHFVSSDQNTLTLTATDGFRLAQVQMPASSSAPFDAIIPASIYSSLAKIYSSLSLDKEEDATIAVSDSQIKISGDGWELRSQKISGTYPDITPIIHRPDSIPTATIDCDELTRMTKTATVLAKEAGQEVSVQVTKEDAASVTVMSKAHEYGRTREEVGCVLEQGEKLEVSMNAGYLMDVLRLGKGTQVKLFNAASTHPLFLEIPETYPNGLWLIMPLHQR